MTLFRNLVTCKQIICNLYRSTNMQQLSGTFYLYWITPVERALTDIMSHLQKILGFGIREGTDLWFPHLNQL